MQTPVCLVVFFFFFFIKVKYLQPTCYDARKRFLRSSLKTTATLLQEPSKLSQETFQKKKKTKEKSNATNV